MPALFDKTRSWNAGRNPGYNVYRCGSRREPLLSYKLTKTAERQEKSAAVKSSAEGEARSYALPLVEVFRRAVDQCPHVSIESGVMAGAPCVEGTRIPVYMILDAVAYYGDLNRVTESYPQLNLDQIRNAISFSKLVVECPLD